MAQENGKLVIDLKEDDHLLTSKEIGEVISAILEGINRIKTQAKIHTDNAHSRITEVEHSFNSVGPLVNNMLKTKADRAELTSLEDKLQSLVDWKVENESSSLPQDVQDVTDAMEEIHEQITALATRIQENKPGDPGKDALPPDHEWDGTRIRFERPDGSWGEWVDLRGKTVTVGMPADVPFGSLQGVTKVRGGTNVTVESDGNGGVIVNSNSGSGSVTVETPPETPNAVITAFTVSARPKWMVADGINYYEGAGYAYTTNTVTFNVPPSQYVRAII